MSWKSKDIMKTKLRSDSLTPELLQSASYMGGSTHYQMNGLMELLLQHSGIACAFTNFPDAAVLHYITILIPYLKAVSWISIISIFLVQ